MWPQRCPQQGQKINWGEQTLTLQRLVIQGASYGAETEIITPSSSQFVLVIGSILKITSTNFKFYSAPAGAFVGTNRLTGTLVNLANGPQEPVWSPSGLFRTTNGQSLWVGASVYPLQLDGEVYYLLPRF